MRPKLSESQIALVGQISSTCHHLSTCLLPFYAFFLMGWPSIPLLLCQSWQENLLPSIYCLEVYRCLPRWRPRFVTHIDNDAIESIRNLYALQFAEVHGEP